MIHAIWLGGSDPTVATILSFTTLRLSPLNRAL